MALSSTMATTIPQQPSWDLRVRLTPLPRSGNWRLDNPARCTLWSTLHQSSGTPSPWDLPSANCTNLLAITGAFGKMIRTRERMCLDQSDRVNCPSRNGNWLAPEHWQKSDYKYKKTARLALARYWYKHRTRIYKEIPRDNWASPCCHCQAQIRQKVFNKS